MYNLHAIIRQCHRSFACTYQIIVSFSNLQITMGTCTMVICDKFHREYHNVSMNIMNKVNWTPYEFARGTCDPLGVRVCHFALSLQVTDFSWCSTFNWKIMHLSRKQKNTGKLRQKYFNCRANSQISSWIIRRTVFKRNPSIENKNIMACHMFKWGKYF